MGLLRKQWTLRLYGYEAFQKKTQTSWHGQDRTRLFTCTYVMTKT